MTEIRYVKPYFSSINLVLHDGVVQVPVVNQQTGEQRLIDQQQKAQLQCNITGWINNNVARSDTFTFLKEQTEGPSMQTVLAAASQLGVDVIAAWQNAFDQIADQFPVTAEQADGSQTMGPPIYLRADAFKANLHPTQNKALEIKVGVYSDAAYQRLQCYIILSFEDGSSTRTREGNIAQLLAGVTNLNSTISLLSEVIVAKETNAEMPANTPVYMTQQTVEQLTQQKVSAEQQRDNMQKEADRLKAVVVGKLSTLLGGVAGSETPLQLSVKQSVGALCSAILAVLKQTNPDYANIDIAKIMSEFAIPSLD